MTPLCRPPAPFCSSAEPALVLAVAPLLAPLGPACVPSCPRVHTSAPLVRGSAPGSSSSEFCRASFAPPSAGSFSFMIFGLVSSALHSLRAESSVRGSHLLLTSSSPSPGGTRLCGCAHSRCRVFAGCMCEEGLGPSLPEWEGSSARALTPLLPSAGCIQGSPLPLASELSGVPEFLTLFSLKHLYFSLDRCGSETVGRG